MCDAFKVEIEFVRKVETILGVPARMMRGIEDPLAALCFLGVVFGRNQERLVVGE